MAGIVTSSSNPAVKRMRALALRKHRRRENAAVVYGIQPVTQALQAGYEVEFLAYAPSLLRNPGALAMVDRTRQAGTRVIALDGGLFARLSGRDGPGGLAAVVTMRVTKPGQIPLGPDAVLLGLDRIANPGNLGTILRTADATGVAGVVLIGACADPYDPAAIKASMGAVFNVPVAKLDTSAAFFRFASEQALPVATTASGGADQLWQTRLPPRLALLMGSEGPGLAQEDVTAGAIALSVPMVGAAESLNVAVATGVVLYEVWRQRNTSCQVPFGVGPPGR